ncbi:DUF2027 domain-containing protein [Dyadobacter sp. Leaf189]|uniref:Smr/MutS family protein n=1 Tax=Dyadobacter sp. Leaf189 TaxID=1736295 RepID=UPI000701751F|nr:DUF2027 domain-containing protein [Dyadobacter sp. Leaf189]KQS31150.1 DNA mismatch repair protein MutS [Dyadobacter sp. Leaf189]
MNIGDKVRLVHGREEGIIYAFLPGNVVEIEIEDGFRIPVLRNEVVTISPVESQRMQKDRELVKASAKSDVIVPRNAPFAEKGIYMAFVSINDKSLTVHLVNNTDWILPFTASSVGNQVQTGLAAGVLLPRQSQKLTEVLMKDFEEWPVFDFNILYFREGKYTLPQPLNKRIKCRAQSFYKSKKKAPVLDKEAFVYQLDEESLKKELIPSDIDAAALKESMLRGTEREEVKVGKPQEIVDLHIEKLIEDPSRISKDSIVKTQLNVFEENLEKAIANGMEEITFIHGAGSGALKNELHKRLSKNRHVAYFKDALKDKFGYGATLVKIK